MWLGNKYKKRSLNKRKMERMKVSTKKWDKYEKARLFVSLWGVRR